MIFGINIFLFVILALTLLSQGLWILIDSQKRGDAFFWLWGLLGFISFPMPIIIYLIITRYGQTRCKNCGKNIEKTNSTCPFCGNAAKRVCHHCGSTIENEWTYCPKCSNKVN
jgi:RNA polymerase subunit RPABC4/transcription elongation factor Spt4